MKARRGILLNEGNDLLVDNGTLKVGERKMQDVFMTLSVDKGDLKEDPLAGINLRRVVRGKERTEKIRKDIEIGLGRMGIKLDDVKAELEVMVNRKAIE